MLERYKTLGINIALYYARPLQNATMYKSIYDTKFLYIP